jgi:hypothetical protein
MNVVCLLGPGPLRGPGCIGEVQTLNFISCPVRVNKLPLLPSPDLTSLPISYMNLKAIR